MLGQSDKFFPQAKILIEKLIQGEKIAVVSHLVLLETIHVLRGKIAENNDFVDNSTKTSSYNQDQSYGNRTEFYQNYSHACRKKNKF